MAMEDEPEAPPSKSWKAEYAKSGRSSCKTCATSIGKGTLRIATVAKSFQFNGLLMHWHHADCILSKPGGFTSLDAVETADDLKPEDIDKLRKYTEAGGKDESSGEFSVETAKSSRSVCKSCKEKITQGEVRIAQMVLDASKPLKTKIPAWRHAKCFVELGWWSRPLEELPGWETLNVGDQKSLSELVKPAAENHKAGKSSAKRNGVAGEVGAAPDSKLADDKSVVKKKGRPSKAKGSGEKRQNGGTEDSLPAANASKKTKLAPKKKDDAEPEKKSVTQSAGGTKDGAAPSAVGRKKSEVLQSVAGKQKDVAVPPVAEKKKKRGK